MEGEREIAELKTRVDEMTSTMVDMASVIAELKLESIQPKEANESARVRITEMGMMTVSNEELYIEPKSSVKEENVSASKSNAPPKGVPAASSTKVGSSSIASGPVSEEEIRAVLMQKTPVTTLDLVAKFKARLRSPEDKKAFAEILKRISKIQKTANGSSYVILRDR